LLYLSDFSQTKIFSTDCQKVRPLAAELYHEEGRMGRHEEANIHFS